MTTDRPELDRARTAAASGDWAGAYAILDRARPDLGPDELMLLGECAYASARLEESLDSWEQAHAGYARARNLEGAAAAAAKIAMHLVIDWGLLAPMRGWLKRAEEYLTGLPLSPVHAVHDVARAYERFYSGDFAEAKRFAQSAIHRGTELMQVSQVALARIALARAHIFEGEIEAGCALLEDASAAATSDEIEELTRGLIYCEIVCAWQGVGMYDVAERWTDAMERFCTHGAVGSVNGRCRIHRAEILRLRGALVDAEREVLAACDELRPYMRREFGWPLTELGDIRLRMGDLHGAEEALLAAHEKGWEPQPGLALLRLAQGDVHSASAMIRNALERPLDLLMKEWPPNNDLRRAPLLEAQVQIELAAGDHAIARAAAAELQSIAAGSRSNALLAAAALAMGRVLLAEGHLGQAITELRSAVHRWSEISAPHELAVARLDLGRAYRAQGFEDGAQLEFKAARATFERIGAALHAAEAAAEISVARRPPSPSPTGANRFRREGDHWDIAFAGAHALLRDVKGLGYLERLLQEPGREFHVLDLVAMGEGRAPDRMQEAGDAGVLLDERAKELYRRRIADIDEDLEEARSFGDAERVRRSAAEREFLVHELARAVGLGGRDRRAGDASERARAAVTRAIRTSLTKIAAHLPELGAHLNHAVRTGTFCSYAPDPAGSVGWDLKRPVRPQAHSSFT